MKLKELKPGDKFMYLNNPFLTDIYVVKRITGKGHHIVGLPGVYDEFASSGDTEVISEN